nr:hypothetical protein BaRGS_034626 [Batillaria attramentaria]
MSGSFALPYLFQDPSLSSQRAVGYVPVAPAGAGSYTDKYPQSQLPTLIVYGTKDPAGPNTKDSLKLLPRSQIVPIPEAGHPCYIDKPDLFHKALYNFLKDLKNT